MTLRDQLEALEDQVLAPYAMRSRDTRGRQHPEPEHDSRTVYQRDRERILHTAAFRRLRDKTQVFVATEGDHYRTRLTHTLEVAQIGRAVARMLRVNEDLTEAVCLAHDLGHPPFGHPGEYVLDELMREHGGFNHGDQSLRVVDWLEQRYPDVEIKDCFRTIQVLRKVKSPAEVALVREAARIGVENFKLDTGFMASE